MDLFQDINTDGLNHYLIFLDIDGTLADDDCASVSDKTIEVMESIKKNNKIFLCSNSRNRERNRQVSRLVDIEYIDTDLRKPNKKILDLIDHAPYKKRLVIGDKFLTDGFFAKNIKAEFIKVKRLVSKNDRFHIKIFYWIDDLFFKLIR